MAAMDVDSDYEASPQPLAAKLASKLSAAAGAKKAPLGDANAGAGAKATKGKTIEETYKKLSQLEHVLLRPDTYVGSVEKQQATLWVHDTAAGLVQREVTYVPGLYKIFDEILVNAADNKMRDDSMDTLKVTIDQAAGTISVWNNGKGIPVEVHQTEGIYVPEMIFGNLLTSSNYDDGEKKVVGGRNGYGAKLANIFSTEFVVETVDGSREKKYRQVFSNNMSVKGKPSITKGKAGTNYTMITFTPDLAKFGMSSLEDDTVALMRKRVYDIAGSVGARGVKVSLNGDRIPVKNFGQYVDLFLKGKGEGGADLPKYYERVNDRWEVAISVSEGQAQQVSFVNSINTIKGGTHVDTVANQVANRIVAHCAKKNKSANVKPFQVKNHLWVFVNALIENPAFDSQCKETLTSKASSFGSKCDLSEEIHKKLLKSPIVENVLSWATFKQNKDLKKHDGAKKSRLTGIPKLDDANEAGTRNSSKCTLILTEGDSAKALAISGLSVVGRDHYGVFPLRGKLLNVRDAAAKQVGDNAEINNIKQILGLRHGQVYEDVKSLRYGHLMIMTDQDHDGSHIKGLLINFLHTFWPSLLKCPDFLVEFITPIVKASRAGKPTRTFYTMPEYEAWKESLGGSTRGWQIKYYKGLGTSTAAEAKEYFADLETHRKAFSYEGAEDDASIEMAFSKKKVEDRKQWLSAFEPGTYLDQSVAEINYADFVNRELILFSLADLQRSIPSMVDGLKPGQRKIMFCGFKRKLKADIKVAQLAGYVSEHSAYHHGEASLAATIVGLAQSFVGSNNVALLVPSGQFGTRLQGGKDSASPRYIFTRLSPLARAVFPEADDQLLDYLNEDGQRIEPQWYMPILPMVLVNGADGIGTGWSTSIPNYNPSDIVANLRRLIAGEAPEPMAPWWRGFDGTIAPGKNGSWEITGKIEQTGPNTLVISELPIRRWTQDYKEFLESMMVDSPSGSKGDKDKDAPKEPPIVKEYKEYHTDETVRFEVTLADGRLEQVLASGGLEKRFKMATSVSTSNMHLFDAEGRIRRYSSPEEILGEFYQLRLGYYDARKAAMAAALESELTRLENKVRFILAVVKGELVIANRKKGDILADLEGAGYDKMDKGGAGGAKAGGGGGGGGDGEAEGEGEDDEQPSSQAGKKGYDYLLGMPLWSLSLERVDKLVSERDGKQAELDELMGTTPAQLWERDLDTFEDELASFEEQCAADQARAAKHASRARGGKAKAKKRGGDDSDDDFEIKPRARPAAKPKPKAAEPAAAVPKPAPVVAKAKAKAESAPAPAPAPAPPAPKEEDDEPPSLMERLKKASAAASAAAGGKRALGATKPRAAPVSAPAPAPSRPGRAAAAKASKYVEIDDSDEEEDDEDDFISDDSPPPKPKARAAPAAAQAKVAGCKRLTKKTSVVDLEGDGAGASADSPLAVPDKKVRRMRPSPFNKKSGSAAAAKAVAKDEAEAEVEIEEEEEEEEAPRARAPRRAAAAANTAVYAEASDSEDEEDEETDPEDEEAEGDSDWE